MRMNDVTMTETIMVYNDNDSIDNKDDNNYKYYDVIDNKDNDNRNTSIQNKKHEK